MDHELFMQRCIQLAKNGLDSTSPNPMVGAILVHNNKIVSEGWHYKPGHPHAEVNAIENLQNKSLLKECTIYVSLEPCSHYGKTPPCATRIIKEGIPKVVIGCRDTSAKVNGQGIAMLKNAGVEVIDGVLEEECKSLNRLFFLNQSLQRPYVHLKWAQSADGYMDIERQDQKGSYQISGPESAVMSHTLRKRHDAILVGYKTALIDNPGLDTRKVSGNNPLRVVIDPKGQLPQNLNIFKDENYLRIIDESHRSQAWGHGLFLNMKQPYIPNMLEELYKQGVYSLLVEGGSKTLQDFIKSNYWDEATIFRSNKWLNKGLKAQILSGKQMSFKQVGNDQHINLMNY